MLQTLRTLFTSRKFLTTIAALIVTGAARYGLDVSQETALAMLGLFAVLVGAQGATDFGKEAARLQSPPVVEKITTEVPGGVTVERTTKPVVPAAASGK